MGATHNLLNMPPGRKAGESHLPFIGASFTGLETLTKLHNRLGPDIRLIPVDRAKHLASDLGFDIRAEAEAALRLAADVWILPGLRASRRSVLPGTAKRRLGRRCRTGILIFPWPCSAPHYETIRKECEARGKEGRHDTIDC